ncbi:MAG: hypothetical protein HYX75_07735 [Acidobacteria bacterium]|nr:hypothetical protein [Acidobacteriota bacterium]
MMTGPAQCHPKIGTFRLADRVGLSTLYHASPNQYAHCTADECRDTRRAAGRLLQSLLFQESTCDGQKGMGGVVRPPMTL